MQLLLCKQHAMFPNIVVLSKLDAKKSVGLHHCAAVYDISCCVCSVSCSGAHEHSPLDHSMHCGKCTVCDLDTESKQYT